MPSRPPSPIAMRLRSTTFNIVFYLNNTIWFFVCLPGLLLPYRYAWVIPKAWARFDVWLFEAIIGTEIEYRGLENIPKGSLLVASKHQSALETLALVPFFDEIAFVVKRQLMWIPLFGWYLRKFRQIPVDRGKRSKALKALAAEARKEVARNRQLTIFPEGTRRAPGAEPRYKYGVVYLYRQLDVPCLPVALNTGLFWPRRQFLRYPGKIVIEFLPPIPPGLDEKVFAHRLEQILEAHSNRLMQEAGRFQPAPPMPVAFNQGKWK